MKPRVEAPHDPPIDAAGGFRYANDIKIVPISVGKAQGFDHETAPHIGRDHKSSNR